MNTIAVIRMRIIQITMLAKFIYFVLFNETAAKSFNTTRDFLQPIGVYSYMDSGRGSGACYRVIVILLMQFNTRSPCNK